MRAAMLGHLATAARPPCATETALCGVLSDMPHATVTRADAAVLSEMGMAAMDCHANSRAFAEDVPGAEWVLGWWDLGHAWTLHSVVRVRGTLACVTPPPRPGFAGTLAYVADPALTVSVEECGDALVFAFAREGTPVDGFPLVRKDPDALRSAAERMRADLAAGADPHALRRRFEEAFG